MLRGRLTKSLLFPELLFSRPDMETPLTPLEFARRARKVYPEQIAVIDGESRWSYAQFLDRCDRWSAVLQRLGIGAGDRVAYLAPNTHAQLESFYSVPQIGAVLVPLNFRLTADDFLYLINHSGARVVCAHRDYLEAINNIRSHLPCVEHFVALTGEANDWLNYEALLQASSAEFVRPEIHETDLLTINYTSGTTSRPKGVMITHRNAWMNSIGTLLHQPMTCADCYLWTLPMFHAILHGTDRPVSETDRLSLPLAWCPCSLESSVRQRLTLKYCNRRRLLSSDQTWKRR